MDEASALEHFLAIRCEESFRAAFAGMAQWLFCRIAMDGGEFAGSLRLVVWSPLLRLASLLTTFTPALKGVEILAIAGTAAFWVAPWLFALAVLHRWRIAESLHELGDRYEKDPESELAKLAAPCSHS